MEWKGLVRSTSDALSDVRPFVSQRQNESDSSTNQIVFHGWPSNVHSFPVSNGNVNLFDFTTIFTRQPLVWLYAVMIVEVTEHYNAVALVSDFCYKEHSFMGLTHWLRYLLYYGCGWKVRFRQIFSIIRGTTELRTLHAKSRALWKCPAAYLTLKIY